MNTLIAEDDFTSRLLLQEMLKGFGPCQLVGNGREAVEAVRGALQARAPFDLICLDIMMPELDGQAALKEIRALEERSGVQLGLGSKVVMTTALGDHVNVMTSFREACDAYVVKPVDRSRLLAKLHELGLIR